MGAIASFGIGLLVSFVHLPYAILMPGPATDVLGTFAAADGSTTPRIQIKDAKTYPTSGSLDFTTVRVAGGPIAGRSALDGDDDVTHREFAF